MFGEFFEFFRLHDARAFAVLDARIFGIHRVQGEIGRAREDRCAERAARDLFFAEFFAHVFADLFPFFFVRLDARNELAVQIEHAETQAAAVRCAVFGQIAHLRARAADVDEHGALAVAAVGDKIAVRLRFPVHKIDRHARAAQDLLAHLLEIFHRAQCRRGNDVQRLRAHAAAFFHHGGDGFGKFVDAARGQAAPLEIVQQREAGTVAEQDLLLLPDLRHEQGNTARTDIDDGDLHVVLPFKFGPPAEADAMLSAARAGFTCRSRRRCAPPRGRVRRPDRRICICPRCPKGH